MSSPDSDDCFPHCLVAFHSELAVGHPVVGMVHSFDQTWLTGRNSYFLYKIIKLIITFLTYFKDKAKDNYTAIRDLYALSSMEKR